MFLLRRSCFSWLHAIYEVLEADADDRIVKLSPAVRAEVRACRRLLPLIWGDPHRLIAPLVLAHDAEGTNENDLGGWELRYARPPIC